MAISNKFPIFVGDFEFDGDMYIEVWKNFSDEYKVKCFQICNRDSNIQWVDIPRVELLETVNKDLFESAVFDIAGKSLEDIDLGN